ncbi:formylglycine-generating enzyme family protein, partial [Anaerolineales bacterium HSG24]|nr:formylglycine-generating enzyme family protein [Anaerolineales bacterium HSG24]
EPVEGMVHVPAGEFSMGSNDGGSDEKPVHTVYLDEFYIDSYEVTNAQFVQFLNDNGNQNEGRATWLDIGDEDVLITESGGLFQAKGGFTNHPVIEVTWFGAKAYCEAQGKRLPTEAEWEKAARGTDGRTYPWGNEFNCHNGNFDDETIEDDYVVVGPNCDGYDKTAPVGSYPSGVSPYGTFDMAGNVLEWVEDCYDDSYYSNSPTDNPASASCRNSEAKVLRGGSWRDDAFNLRAASRLRINPTDTNSNLGFRCLVASAHPDAGS